MSEWMEPTNVAGYYKSLPEAMEDLLPGILKPYVPMKGHEIANLMMAGVGTKWAASSIRYYLANMSRDPRSCVAKHHDSEGVRRSGYVLRPMGDRALGEEKQRLALDAVSFAIELDSALQKKGEPYPIFWKKIERIRGRLHVALDEFTNCPYEK